MSNISRVKAALALDGLAGSARDGFALAADAGYEGVAIATNHTELAPEVLGESGRRHLRKTLEGQRLEIAAIRAAGPRTGLGDSRSIDRTVENARKAIAMAGEMRVPTVGVFAGAIVGSGAETAAVGALKELAIEAERAGVRLAVAGESVEKVAELLAEIDAGSLGVNFTAAGAVGASEDLAAAVAAAFAKGHGVAALTAADAIKAGKQLRLVELGEGQVDWRALLDALRERDFRGPTIVDVRELVDQARGARAAANLLRKVLGS